jgi:hypothetical protein
MSAFLAETHPIIVANDGCLDGTINGLTVCAMILNYITICAGTLHYALSTRPQNACARRVILILRALTYRAAMADPAKARLGFAAG